MLPVISTFVDGKMKHDPFDSFLLGSEIKGTEVFVTLELLFVLGWVVELTNAKLEVDLLNDITWTSSRDKSIE